MNGYTHVSGVTLAPGTRIGPYLIVAKLGEGGMGEVYRAHDGRLGRDVALKVLPPAVRTDADRLARFAREARVLASLNHPNIAAIYGLEEAAGISALVLELVEGDTLADRVAQRALPVAEATRLAVQIADALDAAHEAGIIHRDLKPANIKVRPDGTVKVLDFGLAKAVEAPVGSDVPATGVADAPTRSLNVTNEGLVMGTAAYMSPEQARGQTVDKRTDIWAFGCVLYEMLAGRSAFGRPTLSDTLVAVLEREPDWSQLPPDVPPSLLQLVRRCLERDRTQRLRDIGEAALALRSLQPEGRAIDPGVRAPIDDSGAVVKRTVSRPRAVLIGVLAIALATSLAWWRFGTTTSDAAPGVRSLAVLPLRSIANAPEEQHVGLGIADSLILGLSRARELTVRPVSSVRRYADGQTDALEAGTALGVDAVLDGTWQRDGERVRINLRLVDTGEGRSLWSESLDLQSGDVFALQDQVAGRIMSSLQLAVLPAAAPRTRRPPRPEAHELYTQGLLALTDRGYSAAARANSDKATTLLEQAVRLDPEYAEAHALLGFAYAWTAIFIEENPSLIEKAEVETTLAERLDATIGQPHLNRAFIVWSWYRGWRIVDGIKEVRRAVELTPSLANNELGTLYYHLGLLDDWRAVNERLVAMNPGDDLLRSTYVNEYFLLNLGDEGLAAQRRLLKVDAPDWRYYLAKRDAAGARAYLRAAAKGTLPESRYYEPRVLALEGQHRRAQELVREVVARTAKNRAYHHATFAAAQVFAFGGDAAGAARWLEETIAWGFPCYPVFAADAWLDPVRNSPEVKAVLDRLKVTWESYRDELARP